MKTITQAPFTFIDLFAGIGGIRLGFEQAGYKCVYSSEIDKPCQETYKENFGETPSGDITQIDISKIPEYDVLTAGFPCQPFSICGKKQGFDDKRGNLFFHITDIIKKTNPSVVFLENVKHLIYHDNKKTFKVILNELEKLGYNVTYYVLNAKDFGISQNRERIIIIGSKTKSFNFKYVKRILPSPPLEKFLETDGDFEFLNKEDYTLIENPIKQKSGLIFTGYRNKNIRKKGVRPNTEHLSRVHKQPNRIYSSKGTHPTIPSQESSGRFFIYLPEEDKVRKLTIRECYRIMGFPDNFKINKNKSVSYNQIGNSVCIPMIKEIAIQLIQQGVLNAKSTKKIERYIQESMFG